ncbi:phosphoribosylformylglycinamidine cyclo-ligase [bacterium]|nr:phosphoribosylformylglycinamidine cyclo-ligase [bacterium]
MATTYRDAGVDIDAGDELVRRIKPAVKATFNENVLTELGLFGGAFRLDTSGMEEPVWIASTDGVGTKTKVADWAGMHGNIGRDLVNHCINDIFTCGAKPLFFLDYYATARLDVDIAEAVLNGLASGCKASGVALLGGETAEMPGVYTEGVYDLAGTIMGVVDRPMLIDGSKIREGDFLIGLASDGLHTNGYTLARKALIEPGDLKPDSVLDGMEITVAEALLTPHRCYYPAVSRWLERGLRVRGMAHITGGGLEGNTSRIIPDGLKAQIDWDSWETPPLFRHIRERADVPEEDMRRTFNLGIGWVMIVPPDKVKESIMHAMNVGIGVYKIGEVVKV